MLGDLESKFQLAAEFFAVGKVENEGVLDGGEANPQEARAMVMAG